MALNRLKRKAAERRRRASLSRSNSPMGGGEGRIGSGGSPRTPGSPGSPDNGGGAGDGTGGSESSPTRGRRPSLMQVPVVRACMMCA